MKELLLLIMLFSSTALFAQKKVVINGTVSGDKCKVVTLYYIEDGKEKQYAVTNIAADGSFAFSLNVTQEAFYMLDINKRSHTIYLKPSDVVNVSMSDNGKALVLTGKNSRENIELYKWEEASKNIRNKSVYFLGNYSTYKDFFPDFEKCNNEFDALYQRINSGDKKFDELLRQKMKYDRGYYAMSYLYTPRNIHPTVEQRPPFYSSIISKDKFNSDIVMSLPYGAKMISMFSLYVAIENKIGGFSEDVISYFGNDRLKGELVIANCNVKDYASYEIFKAKFEKYLVTPSQKARFEEIAAKVANDKAGEKASDFTYPDLNDKMVSLSDFKGKVVLVDVWATWCGPCKKQIPALIQLEKDFHGSNDIVFMSVSVDESKDKQKWLDMIKEMGLGGVQLFASGWSKITKDYKITGIPRFMLFDKKGNIYSINAPRPSAPELKEMINKLLAQ